MKKLQDKAVAALVIVVVAVVSLRVLIIELTLEGVIALAVGAAVLVSFERHHKAQSAHRALEAEALAKGHRVPNPPATPLTVTVVTSLGHLVVRVLALAGWKITSALRDRVNRRRSHAITAKATKS